MTDLMLKQQFSQIQKGDNQAFSAVYQALKIPVFTVLVRLTGDWQLSEDLLQEVFLKLYREPPQVEQPRAYVFRMAHNLAIDTLRKRQCTDPLGEDVLSDEPDLAVRLDLETAFSQLRVEECRVVALHLSAGLTFREVAKIVEQPLGTVLWRYRRAIGKLRNLLDGGRL